MLKRYIENKIKYWLENDNRALLINGARQTGKTSSVRNVCKNAKGYDFYEINFIEQKNLVSAINEVSSAKELLSRLSLMVGAPLRKNHTIIFFDEVQECREIATIIKFLVDDGSYRFILSGSLLGVELSDVRSVPVGYLSILEMYPLTLREFFINVGVSEETMANLYECFSEKKPVDEYIHSKLMSLFYLYLVIGGMPQAVQKYVDTNDLKMVASIQTDIIRLYKEDFSKYDKNEKFLLQDIYDAIPSELEEKNRRFMFSHIAGKINFDRVENKFLWLKNAGVALPVYNVTEPVFPLRISEKRNLFKLFMGDVGLLMNYYSDKMKLKLLSGKDEINFGGIFENFVAQELYSKLFSVYYYNSKKSGEIDFLIERNDEILPIEVKSGKDYLSHHALNNLLSIDNFEFNEAFVLFIGNVDKRDRIIYYPIYMTMFIENDEIENSIYKIDVEGL